MIYPNPIFETDDLAIQFSSNQTEEIEIQLLDINGQLKLSEQKMIKNGQNQFKISSKDLAKGIYLLQIQMDNQIFTKKVIKQ